MIISTLANINASITNFTQSTYGSLATDIGTIGVTCGAIGLVLISINMIFQIVPSHPGALVIWAIKFMIVLAAASNWAFFNPIYTAVSQIPGAISAQILGGTNMETSMQAAVDELWNAYDTLWSSAGIRQAHLFAGAIIIAIVAVLLTVAMILVIGIAQMGLAMSLGLAPIFIVGLLFRATSDLFSSWTKFTLSFILILVLTATVISLLLVSVSNAVNAAKSGTVLQDFAPLIVQAVASIFFIMMVPNYAMALAGSMAASGITLISAAGGAMGLTKGAIQSGVSGVQSARTGIAQARSMATAAGNTRGDGGNTRQQMMAARDQYIQDRKEAWTLGDKARLRETAKTNRSENLKSRKLPPSKK